MAGNNRFSVYMMILFLLPPQDMDNFAKIQAFRAIGRCAFGAFSAGAAIAGTMLYQVQIDALQHHQELVVGKLKGRCLAGIMGDLKSALFQALIKNPKTVAIPQKQLDAILASIEKNINIAGKRVLSQVIGHQAG